MQYDECIKDCDKAIERGKELRADFKMIARALTRKGIAFKALTKHLNPDTLNKLNDAERVKKELEQQKYFDPKIADEEHKKPILPIKNPKDPKVSLLIHYDLLSNSDTGAHTMSIVWLVNWLFASKKGYTSKSAIQFFMKEYDKALKTYQEGLKHDPNNQELLDSVYVTCHMTPNGLALYKAILFYNWTDIKIFLTNAKAMQDPEIQTGNLIRLYLIPYLL
ncbi:LOW QUALITY PROTEIN: hypothetical protein Cgig2_011852 [Carnegiea gigantea]|uniref:Uncharacterized protein n=1 Tax=Carnegiea gigantea TaxID=171969 RepID=A0A9Q1Q5X8_9CARY|nr:LOW QUALITY PROTEIN: hypothetical protein Cgig2_011852 [Carnegiea gigantea]